MLSPAQALVEAGYPCSVVKPTALGKVKPAHHRKDDAYDAQCLAESAQRFLDKLVRYEVQPAVLEQVKLLYNERRRLVKEQSALSSTQAKNAFAGTDTGFINTLRTTRYRFLNQQIQQFEAEIERVIETEAGLAIRYRQLLSVAGIGPKTAWLWLYYFYGQDRLNPRRISSRFGMAAHREESGTSLKRKGRSSGHGSGEMRQLLTMCARSACLHHEHYRAYKQRKLAEGKPKLLITNNVRNKLTRVICAVWNQNTTYDAQKQQKNVDWRPVAA